jgi:hypothetical protein
MVAAILTYGQLLYWHPLTLAKVAGGEDALTCGE